MALHFSRSDMNRMAKQVEQHNKKVNAQLSALVKRGDQRLNSIVKAYPRVSPVRPMISPAQMNKIRKQVEISNGKLANTAKLLANVQRELKRAEHTTRLVHGTKAQRALRYALKKAQHAYIKTKQVVRKLQSVSPVVYVR